MRLLHELEFVQVEDMKSQMEKLVQFLSESENVKEELSTQAEFHDVEIEVSDFAEDKKENNDIQQEGLSPMPLPSTSKKIPEVEIKEGYPQIEGQENRVKPNLIKKRVTENKDFVGEGFPHNVPEKELPKDILHPHNKSLNDIQPTNHTFSDNTKSSISLNDKFVFQRELFNNNKQAMDVMLLKLQSYTDPIQLEDYLRRETDWDFKDETVKKFTDMLKEGF